MSVSDKFAQQLLQWFAIHGRHDLPWQKASAAFRTTSPAAAISASTASTSAAYPVWLSEIMLQQTQVSTVIPYFQKFISRFPTIKDLASADEQEVLSLWSGLGYYARARNLLACARVVMRDHGGLFPETAAALATLPGIGPSTAAAIASTVFHERAAILDGNVKRVLARITCAEAPWGSPALERDLQKEAKARLPQRAADMPAYTQAIMDLGATVCRARTPACGDCPLQSLCRAFQKNRVADYPRPRPRRVLPERSAAWCVAIDDHGVWLQQQPSPGIWGGLWAPWAIDLRVMPPDWHETASRLREVVEITHTFTHFRLKISAGIFVSKTIDPLPPRGAPKGMKKFPWQAVLSQPLPAPVKQLLLRLCPSGPESDGEPRKNSRH